ncbi:hypothetical protein [Polaromonas sp. CG9_12]|nr:hypothetical protein [Polaromonas sp. CG9_12]
MHGGLVRWLKGLGFFSLHSVRWLFRAAVRWVQVSGFLGEG